MRLLSFLAGFAWFVHLNAHQIPLIFQILLTIYVKKLVYLVSRSHISVF